MLLEIREAIRTFDPTKNRNGDLQRLFGNTISEVIADIKVLIEEKDDKSGLGENASSDAVRD